MLTDILKGVEMVAKAVTHFSSPDIKRQRMARELLRLYLETVDLIANGRQLLTFLRAYGEHSGDEILQLLRSQDLLLRQISQSLTVGPIAEILKLHLTVELRQFQIQVNLKWNDVELGIDYLFDQLVSKDNLVTPRQDPRRYILENDLTIVHFPRRGSAVGLKSAEVEVFFSPPALESANRLLDELEHSANGLKAFIIDKFKFEDVM